MSGFRAFLGDIDDLVGDDDVLYLGDDDDLGDDDELGAAPRARRARALGRGRPNARLAAQLSRKAKAAAVLRDVNGMTGLPQRQAVIEPLGFTVVTFGAATGTTLQATATPQKPMKGSRLLIAEVRSATATGLVTLTSLKIGQREVLLSAQGVPIAGFANNAVGVSLALVEAHPGIIITATYVISAAPVMAETVTVGTMINALSME